MDKQAALTHIREEAFQNEIEKTAISEGALARAIAGRASRAIPRATKTVRNELHDLIKSNIKGFHWKSRALDPKGVAADYTNMIQNVIPKRGKINMSKLFGGKNPRKRSLGEYHVSGAQSRKLQKKYPYAYEMDVANMQQENKLF